MTERTSQQLERIVSGLKLLYELFGKLDKALVRRALSRKLAVPNVTRVPSWEDTEAFITANPAFLGDDAVRSWWETRERNQSRIRLMIALSRQLRRGQTDGIHLFAPEIRRDSGLFPLVLSVADAVKRILEDPEISKEEKTRRIADLLKGAAK